jgi:hypothetical protein
MTRDQSLPRGNKKCSLGVFAILLGTLLYRKFFVNPSLLLHSKKIDYAFCYA